MLGKGRITLDDIAVGVTYNNEPYTSNNRFSVITPDVPSQQKFFTVENYTHKYLEKVKRSPFIEYLIKKKPIDNYMTCRPATSRTEDRPGLLTAINKEVKLDTKTGTEIEPITEQKEEAECTMKPEPVVEGETKEILGKPKVEFQPHGKPGTNTQKRRIIKAKTFARIPKEYGIYHPGQLYVPNGESIDAPFYKTNPYFGTRYYNASSVLGMDHNRTLRDVIIKSSEAESSTARTIRQQFDRK